MLFPFPFRFVKQQLEDNLKNKYNEIIKAERLLPPHERLPLLAAPPRLEVMTTRLVGWVAFKGDTLGY
jgi:hypothetical protein